MLKWDSVSSKSILIQLIHFNLKIVKPNLKCLMAIFALLPLILTIISFICMISWFIYDIVQNSQEVNE